MKRIVASILDLAQHFESLADNPELYRPNRCPHCSFGKLWNHGCYERKADRGGGSLNPVPVPRYLCLACGKTCSRLPECLAPRRWYDWLIQQMVYLDLLAGFSIRCCSRVHRLSRTTVRRWWRALKQRHDEFAFFLKARFPEWGRTACCTEFWRMAMDDQPLSRMMFWLDHEGVIVP